MSDIVDIRPRLSETDRLGVTAFGSLLFHMLVILGVTFALPKIKLPDGAQTLEITLVQSRSDRVPDKAEFLAQANQDGGGDSDRPDIARNPLPLREISDSQRIPAMRPIPQKPVPAKRDQRELMTQQQSNKSIATPQPEPQRKEARLSPQELGLPALDARAERARLNAEISRTWQEYQQRPRKKFLNARTQEYKFAMYMSTWVARVERVGNINYPAEAKHRGIRGNLVLDVVVLKDGKIKEITVVRSSGHKLLDDAARRIVELSSPFSAFPPDIQAEYDELHITRTWKFNDTLSADMN